MENLWRASKACGRCGNGGWRVKNHVSCSTSTFCIMHAPYLPPKILHNHCFQFLLGRLQYPGEMKTKVMQNLRGQIRCIMGNMEGRILNFCCRRERACRSVRTERLNTIVREFARIAKSKLRNKFQSFSHGWKREWLIYVSKMTNYLATSDATEHVRKILKLAHN